VSDRIDLIEIRCGFWIIVGFGLVTFITVVSIFRWDDATNVATVVSAVSMTGCLRPRTFDEPAALASFAVGSALDLERAATH
jgi:hypothetical protein